MVGNNEESIKIPSFKQDEIKLLKIKSGEEFLSLEFNYIERRNYQKNTYDIYSDSEHYDSVTIESLYNALNDNKIKNPYKILNTHSKIPDILKKENTVRK